jgi:YidC/Oxa1 family membrane protein insertase
MDKRTTLAFLLIGLIFMVYFWQFSPSTPPPSKIDSTAHKDTVPTAAIPAKTQEPAEIRLGDKYAANLQGNGRFITIDAPLYKAIINTRGALLSRFELKHYKAWYGAPVQLIEDSTGFPGELGVEYTTPDGRRVTTEDLYFTVDAPDKITLGEKDSVVITARLAVGGAADSGATGAPRTIEKRFVFRGNSYGVGFDVATANMNGEMAQGGYDITWKKGIKYQENNSVDESSKAKSIAVVNNELTEVDASEVGKPKQEKFTGQINWVGTHVKYFGMALIPSGTLKSSTATISGDARNADSSGRVESYGIDLRVPTSGATSTQSFTLFIGPLDYDVASSFGLQGMLDFGARFIVRPIGEFFMLPIFRFLHGFIGNYGVVIIVFSLLIRLLLWPLSIPQIKSSRKMQLLQPKIAEIRERFKDDPQKQQMETMNVYREYGINPVGGCLPMVLQLPILYALWGTLGSAIELRQANFGLWVHDLSIPDVVAHLPFAIPLLGDKLSGLALIMGVTLFIQQKMMLTDPKQKAMVYFMPLLLTLTFNHFPSGLNLYYLTFNLLAIGQQVYMTKYAKNSLTLEDMRRDAKNKKKGWLAQKMEQAQKMAEMQQTGARPADKNKKVDGRTAVEPKKK